MKIVNFFSMKWREMGGIKNGSEKNHFFSSITCSCI